VASVKGITTGEACQQYAFANDGDCQLTQYLVVDRDAARWMSNVRVSGMQVHHIHKRRKAEEHNWWCNLIRIEKAAHDFCHDRNPIAGELACWYAKKRLWEMQQLLYPGFIATDRRHTCIAALNRIVKPFQSFAARIEHLRDKCRGTKFEHYGDELVMWLKH